MKNIIWYSSEGEVLQVIMHPAEFHSSRTLQYLISLIRRDEVRTCWCQTNVRTSLPRRFLDRYKPRCVHHWILDYTKLMMSTENIDMKRTGGEQTDSLRRNQVTEEGGEQDEHQGVWNPGQELQRDVPPQLPVNPFIGWRRDGGRWKKEKDGLRRKTDEEKYVNIKEMQISGIVGSAVLPCRLFALA